MLLLLLLTRRRARAIYMDSPATPAPDAMRLRGSFDH